MTHMGLAILTIFDHTDIFIWSSMTDKAFLNKLSFPELFDHYISACSAVLSVQTNLFPPGTD